MRKQVVELLLSEHDGDCQTCDRNEDCELKRLASDMGIREVPYRARARRRTSTLARRRWCATTPSASSAAAASTVCGQTQGVGALFPQGRGFSRR
jgi:NADP-reducing hydrogenase subunit HndD